MIAVLLAAIASPAFSQPTPVSTVTSDEKIHPGDLIEIDELGGFDFDWRGRLDPDGFLAGFTKVTEPVFGRCKTTNELAEAIRSAYSKTLRDPQVVVRILDRSQRPVAIFDGAIRQPMRLQIRRPVRLTELIVMAGGFTDRASGEISVLRPANQNCQAANDTAVVESVRADEILAGKESANLQIMSGDIVTVKVVEPVYVLGGINRPGRVDWRPGATLSRVVAAAGGVSDRGVSGKVSIFRRTGDGSRVISVNLDKVDFGSPSDVEILPRDIVDVPLKGSPRRTSPPVVEAVEPTTASQPLPVRIID